MDSSAGLAPRFVAPAGTFVGWRDGAVVRVSGIRYARAARFEPPVPEPPAAAPVLATASAPACPQLPDPVLAPVLGEQLSRLTFSEDCLRLSLARPAGYQPGQPLLPVLVWVHGGSYVTGAGDLPLYDPAALVAEQQVVFVAVTYRLGLLGFLGGAGGPPPNLGLLDLREALRWVQRNVAAFGGDPQLVTLLGQSSGADAIAHLLAAEGTAGLCRRVILHSAPLGLARGRQRLSRAVLAAAGPLAAATPLADVLAASGPATRAGQRYGLRGAMPFSTQYGAYPLPAEATVPTAWQARAPAVDVLVGATAEETRFFAVTEPRLRWLATLPLVGKWLVGKLVQLTSRRIYQRPAREFARRHAQAGGRAYVFSITYRPPGSEFGAAHVIDLPLLLGTPAAWQAMPLLGRATWAEAWQAGRPLRDLWLAFARTGRLPAPLAVPGVVEVVSG